MLPLEGFYTSALAGYLNILFFPMMALLILGIGYAQAWFASSDWEFVEPTHEEMFPELETRKNRVAQGLGA